MIHKLELHVMSIVNKLELSHASNEEGMCTWESIGPSGGRRPGYDRRVHAPGVICRSKRDGGGRKVFAITGTGTLSVSEVKAY